MSRRGFLGMLAAAAAAAALGAWQWTKTAPPVRWVKALRGARYPGRVRPLDPESIRRAGRWLG